MNIGLVLSGGMAKGAFQIGALKALNSFIPLKEIKYVSCSSVGVLNGYSYITGNLDKGEKAWRTICADTPRLSIGKILKSNMLDKTIKDLCEGEPHISAPIYSTLFDLNAKNVVYKDLSTVSSDELPKYLKACVSMPVYNKSVKIDDAAFFDGAMIDNIPVYPLIEKELDYLICIYFDSVCYKFESTSFDNKIIKITFPSETVLKQSIMLDQNAVDNMIYVGYERTFEILSHIFSNGYEDKRFIFNAIKAKQSTEKSLRLTGDVFVTNLNKITQQLSKKKIQ